MLHGEIYRDWKDLFRNDYNTKDCLMQLCCSTKKKYKTGEHQIPILSQVWFPTFSRPRGFHNLPHPYVGAQEKIQLNHMLHIFYQSCFNIISVKDGGQQTYGKNIYYNYKQNHTLYRKENTFHDCIIHHGSTAIRSYTQTNLEISSHVYLLQLATHCQHLEASLRLPFFRSQ